MSKWMEDNSANAFAYLLKIARDYEAGRLDMDEAYNKYQDCISLAQSLEDRQSVVDNATEQHHIKISEDKAYYDEIRREPQADGGGLPYSGAADDGYSREPLGSE